MSKKGPKVPQERPKGDLVTSLVMMKDMIVLIIFIAMLGNIVTMMCTSILNTMLNEQVRVEHYLEDHVEQCVQNIDYAKCLFYVVHVCKRRQCVQLRRQSRE